jgi:FkbM family methyltransferase
MIQTGAWNSQLENKRYQYNLNSNSIVIDLGGYVGQWAYNIVNRFNCTVHSYEAVERYFNQINHLGVISYHAAVTCKTGTDYIHVCDEGSAVGSLADDKKKNDKDNAYQNNVLRHSNIPLEKINTIDINEVLEDFDKVDLLKINIEGGEYDILSRMCSTGTINKVDNLQIQFHNFVVDADDKYNDIVNKLQSTHSCDFNSMWRWSFWSKNK